MKFKTFNQILRAANTNEENLIRLSQAWRSSYFQNQDLLEPVTCLKHLKKKINKCFFYFFFYPIVGFLLSFALFRLFGSTMNLLEIVAGCVTALTATYFFYWPLRQRNCTPTFKNGIRFAEIIEKLEDFTKDELMRWDFVRQNDLMKDLEVFLKVLAHEKDRLSRAGWREEEAEKAMVEWKKLHSFITRLFPELPSDYDHYFPKEGRPE